MPIFQYDTYRNPYGPSIAEALAHQADAPAAGALQVADIQARAQQQQAALWGNAISGLGQIPGEIQAQRDAAAKRAQLAQQTQLTGQQIQEGALTLADKQAQHAADVRLGQLLAAAPRNPDDTVDTRAFMKSVPPELIKYAGPWVQQANTQAEGWRAEDAQRLGRIQTQAAGLYQAGAPFAQTQGLIEQARRDRILTDDQATQYKNQLVEAPGGARTVLRAMAGYQKPILKKEDEAIIDPVSFETLLPGQGKPGEGDYTIANQRFNAQHQPVGPPVAAPPTGEEQIALLFGKQAAGQTLTATETAQLEGWKAKEGSKPFTVKTVVNGRPVEQVMTTADAMKQGLFTSQPPASVQVLNQTLAGGQHVTDTAKAIAEYRVAPPSPRSLQTPAGELLMTQVMTANPAYDATQFPTRQKMRVAFTSGPQSQTINSLNTAIGHLDQFTEVVKALDNGSFQPGNQAFNWLKTTFGDSAPTNFEGIRGIMSGELAAAFKKSGATDQEIASVERAIASKNSTGQLLDYVQTIALPALGSKVVNFDQQYRQVMGAADPFQILLPESAQILQKYGIDPAHPTMGARGGAATPAAPAPPPTGTIRTNPANGAKAMWDGTRFVPVK